MDDNPRAAGRALLVADMQNGLCHPEGSFPRITDGYHVGPGLRVPVSA